MIFITLSGMSLLCASTQSLILEQSACNTYRCSIVHEHQRFSVEDNTPDRHTNYPELEISFCVYMHMYLGAIDQPQVAGPLTGLGLLTRLGCLAIAPGTAHLYLPNTGITKACTSFSSGRKLRSLFVWYTVYWLTLGYFPGLEVNVF